MKVKVGNPIYDGEETPVMVILTDADKNSIRCMPLTRFKYACFPETDTRTTEEKKVWMNS